MTDKESLVKAHKQIHDLIGAATFLTSYSVFIPTDSLRQCQEDIESVIGRMEILKND